MGKTDALKSLREASFSKKKDAPVVKETVKQPKIAPKKAKANKVQPAVKKKPGPVPRDGEKRIQRTLSMRPSIWNAFMAKYPRTASSVIEGLMKKDLGIK